MMVENAAACPPLCLPLHDQRQLSVTRTQTRYLEDEVLIVTLAPASPSEGAGPAGGCGLGRGRMQSACRGRLKLTKIKHNSPGSSSPWKLQAFE